MPAPDDFTVTLLHRIQDQRTTPQGGWLSGHDLRSLMGLSDREGQHLGAPLKELFDAGMIERRFNAALARDEWRSIGVRPAMGPESNAHDQLDGVVLPRSDRPGPGYTKAIDDLEAAVDAYMDPNGGKTYEDLFEDLITIGWTPPRGAR